MDILRDGDHVIAYVEGRRATQDGVHRIVTSIREVPTTAQEDQPFERVNAGEVVWTSSMAPDGTLLYLADNKLFRALAGESAQFLSDARINNSRPFAASRDFVAIVDDVSANGAIRFWNGSSLTPAQTFDSYRFSQTLEGAFYTLLRQNYDRPYCLVRRRPSDTQFEELECLSETSGLSVDRNASNPIAGVVLETNGHPVLYLLRDGSLVDREGRPVEPSPKSVATRRMAVRRSQQSDDGSAWILTTEGDVFVSTAGGWQRLPTAPADCLGIAASQGNVWVHDWTSIYRLQEGHWAAVELGMSPSMVSSISSAAGKLSFVDQGILYRQR